MVPEFDNGNVRADCPQCGAPTTFLMTHPGGRGEYGTVLSEGQVTHESSSYSRTVYKLLSCTVCEHPGVATVLDNGSYRGGRLISFWPRTTPRVELPAGLPEPIRQEIREAELCISAPAHRAAAALLRSALEKTLIENGYASGSLFEKIETAAGDGVITAARRRKAQELVRVLGNDVLHGDWREVTADEVQASHHYVTRIVEDLYDDRDTTVSILVESGRLQDDRAGDQD